MITKSNTILEQDPKGINWVKSNDRKQRKKNKGL